MPPKYCIIIVFPLRSRQITKILIFSSSNKKDSKQNKFINKEDVIYD